MLTRKARTRIGRKHLAWRCLSHPPHHRGSAGLPAARGPSASLVESPGRGGGHSEDALWHQVWQAVRFSEEGFSSPSLLATLVLSPGLWASQLTAGPAACPLPAEACVTPSWLTTPPPALPGCRSLSQLCRDPKLSSVTVKRMQPINIYFS
uniref:Uncharacterized protein n=1 Tax=Pipistrellus kuhlii TaxID=59472 RepID=A0A7J7TXH7_PIPKU|nr:hypothetical protein mPipKuh1_009197 [Pipistrellus kuhlii]